MPQLLGQGVNTLRKAKGDVDKSVTKLYQLLQVNQSFQGYHKSYTPLEEEGRQLPDDVQTIKQDPLDLVAKVRAEWTKLFDMIASCDATNCTARADVIVQDADGNPFTLLTDVPVTTLLAAEKWADNILTLIRSIPTLSMSHDWTWDANANRFAAPPELSEKTEKKMRHKVLVEPTEHHPAQVEVYHEDVPVGTWRLVRQSTARPAAEVAAMAKRAVAFKYAIGEAIQSANTASMTKVERAKVVFDYILQGSKPQS